MILVITTILVIIVIIAINLFFTRRNIYIGVNVFGGLGNRMFEIASAYGIARRNNAILSIHDVSDNDNHSGNKFNDLTNIFPIYPGPFYSVYNEKKEFEFTDVRLLSNTIVSGYFQHEDYFKDYRKDILEIFKEPSNLYNLEKYNYENTIAIHVRLGDYMHEGIRDVLFIDLDLYYSRAINYILSKVPNANFIIVSEEPKEEVIKIYKSLEHYPNKEKALDEREDMYFMSRCRGVICANSTFSWWGAYLNTRNDKIITLPSRTVTKSDKFLYMKGAQIIDT